MKPWIGNLFFSDVISKCNHDLKEKQKLIYFFEFIENFIIPPLPTDPTTPSAHIHTQHNECAE